MYKTVCLTLTPIAWLYGCSLPEPAPPPDPVEAIVELSDAQVSAVHSDIRRRLKDPNSAIFGPIAAGRLASGLPEQGIPNLYVVCGEVNARNSFGGYTGNQPYLGTLEGDAFPEITSMTIAGATIPSTGLRGLCAQYGLPIY